MNCQKVGDLFSAYIEGEVVGRQCASLEAHLMGCAGCREELETLRSALVLLATPKTLVRPEGLLEEFKEKYLPEAETATAPRWGFWLPVLPKIEWPSLNRLMLPMGSMAAAGAAAALIVALHGHSVPMGTPPGTPKSVVTVARNPTRENSVSPGSEESSPLAAALADGKATPTARTTQATKTAKAPSGGSVRPHRHSSSVMASLPAGREFAEHRKNTSAPSRRQSRHGDHHSRLRMIAHRIQEAPPVPLDSIKSALHRPGDVVRSDELQWQSLDQGGAIAHKAAAPAAEDGYAEASCKNLTTGKVLRSAAVTDPAEPGGLPSGPVGVEPGGDR